MSFFSKADRQGTAIALCGHCGYACRMMDLELPVRTPLEQPDFLPMSRSEMDRLGWAELDVLLVCGDAYVDHPSFGVPLLGRWLIAHGYRTGLITQPRWDGQEGLADVRRMGRPRLLAGISAGAIDSMLAHYTAFRRRRHDDAYTPGGRTGARPNRAVIVYAGLLRRAFPGLPLIAGGIEASLRRISHYDFWTDSLKRPLLFDAPLDVIVCGMGETALLELVRRVDALHELLGDDPASLTPAVADSFDLWRGVRGTARLETLARATALDGVMLPSDETMRERPAALLEGSIILERECHHAVRRVIQPCGSRAVVLEPPAAPLDTPQLDALYALPYARRAHPSYREPVPAEAMMRTSITSHRGCGGGCSFCSLALHQGRQIASRSEASILDEIRTVAAMPWFNGSISDIGGPSANMWRAACRGDAATCWRDSCMFPAVCPLFEDDQTACVAMLRKAAAIPGVRHVRIASGVRFDLALRNRVALEAYAGEFTGGQLKIAPEHCVPAVLKLMRKPGLKPFEAFLAAFVEYSRAHGKEQYVIPYMMSAFPGCTDDDMRELARWLKARHWSPRQVQCFIPTPGTVATGMYYAGVDPQGRPLYVARSDAERRRQHDILLGADRQAGDSDPPRMDRGQPRAGGQGRRAVWKQHKAAPSGRKGVK